MLKNFGAKILLEEVNKAKLDQIATFGISTFELLCNCAAWKHFLEETTCPFARIDRLVAHNRLHCPKNLCC